MKKTKILLSSILTIMLCVSLITGATFALFTSESSVNIAITSGKVQVEATIDPNLSGYYYVEGTTEHKDEHSGANMITINGSATATIDGKELTVANFAPGYVVSFGIGVVNHSTVAAKYSVEIAATDKDGVDLFKALKITVAEKTGEELSLNSSTSGNRYSEWKDIAAAENAEAGNEIQTLNVTVEFPFGDNDNALQSKTCNIAFAVRAIQGNAKAEALPSTEAIGIYSVTDLNELANQIEAQNGYEGKTIVLMRDIDFNNPTTAIAFTRLADMTSSFSPIGTAEAPFKGKFDGQGYAIKNLSVEGTRAALFGVTENAAITNVNIVNANVKATGENASAGLLVGEAKGTLSLSNITVEDCTVSKAEDASDATVGALVGDAQNTTVTVDSVNVQLNENDSELGGVDLSTDLVGKGDVTYEGKNELAFELSSGFVEKIVKNGTEGKEESWYEVSSEAGLRYFADTVNGNVKGEEAKDYKGKTVKLVANISLGNKEWTPIGNNKHIFSGEFDGQKSVDENGNVTSYTIGNLNIKGEGGLGLFNVIGGTSGLTNNPKVKNLNINNATVAGTGSYIGVLAGSYNRDDVENINITGHIEVSGTNFVGGLTGYAYGDITNCSVNVDSTSFVKGIGGQVLTEQNIGGIVGYMGEGTNKISGCETNVAVLAENESNNYTASVGAIAGRTNANTTIENCKINNAKITLHAGAGARFGAIAGDALGAVTYKNNIGSVTIHIIGDEANLTFPEKGLVGKCVGGDLNLTESENNIVIDYVNNLGTLRNIKFGEYSSHYFIQEIEVGTATELRDAFAIIQEGKAISKNHNPATRGENPITINFQEGAVIDLQNKDWNTVDLTSFILSGNGATIKNINAVADKDGKAGFIGYAGNVMIKELTLENVRATGSQVGAIAAQIETGKEWTNVMLTGNVVLNWSDSAITTSETEGGIGIICGVYVDGTVGGVTLDCNAKLSVGNIAEYTFTNTTKWADSGLYLGRKFYAENSVDMKNIKRTDSCTITVDGIEYTGVNKYAVSDAEGLLSFNTAARNGQIPSGEGIEAQLTLKDNIDMKGKVWDTISLNMLIIDGGGKTLSNVVCKPDSLGKAALLGGSGNTIKNLTVENFEARGEQAAVFIANPQGGCKIENCTIKGNVKLGYEDVDYDEKYASVGVIIGVYQNEKGFENITIEEGCVIDINLTGMTTEMTQLSTDLLFGFCNDAEVSEEVYGTVTNKGTINISGGVAAGYIFSESDLIAFREKNADGSKPYRNKTVYLMKDITLTSDWTPITNFVGTFDGNGYTISNLNINVENVENVGLFGLTNEGGMEKTVIKNLNVDNANIVEKAYGSWKFNRVGVVAGGLNSVNGEISNVKVTNATIRITKSEFTGTVVAGGIAGYNPGCTNDCYADVTIIDETGKSNVGGIIGQSWGDIIGCYAKVNISGSDIAGGIVGTAVANNSQASTWFKGEISNNYATGTIEAIADEEGNVYSGGLIGDIHSAGTWAKAMNLKAIKNNFCEVTVNEYCNTFIGNSDFAFETSGNSWKSEETEQKVYDVKNSTEKFTVTKEDTCIFKSGMGYQDFLNALAALEG